MTAIEKAIQAVVKTAEAEIGYMEKASNSQLNDKTANAGSGNWTKYGAWFDAQRGTFNVYNGAKNGYDWCDVFVDFCFCSTFGLDTGRKMLYQPMNSCGAGCKFSADYYRQNNAWSSGGSTPRVGDQIFFGPKGDESHTGLVVAINGGKVYTVEGNAGNRVQRREYSIADSYIAGYGRPDFYLASAQFSDDAPPATVPIKDDDPAPAALSRDAILAALNDEWIETFADLPDWAKPEMRAIIECGYFKGTRPADRLEDTYINGTLNSLVRPVIVAWRIVKGC